MNIKLIAVMFLFYCSSCVAPKQPPLNKNEEKFIKDLEEK